MDFTTITIEALQGLSHITGGYGWAIIFLTVIIRLVMWPLSVSQQKSMKKMQELSPKLKEIQNRYKSDPQVMQKKMMEFYKEHSFNPFSGCFPLILQMPIFFILYAALISPQFIEMSGKSSFFFVNRLDATIKSHAGVVGDRVFGVDKNDTFASGKDIKVYTDKGIIKDIKIKDPNKAFIEKDHKLEIKPGQPVSLKFNIDQIDPSTISPDKIQKAESMVINNTTKEIEHITFNKDGNNLSAQIQTEAVKTKFNYDVLALIVLFGISMFLSQKVMTSTNNTAAMDSAQQEMQAQMSKIMPVMMTVMFVFFPIPAGVLLYLVVSNVIQVAQTVIINKNLEKEALLKPKTITPKTVLEPKVIETVAEKETIVVNSPKNNTPKKKKKNNNKKYK